MICAFEACNQSVFDRDKSSDKNKVVARFDGEDFEKASNTLMKRNKNSENDT
jgi:5-methylcytosine-specific restriction endonuclease McrBC regulatory subunit McrC